MAPRSIATVTLLATTAALWPAPALAHGSAPAAPELPGLLASWRFDPFLVAGLLAALALYLWAVRRVDRDGSPCLPAGRRAPFPRYHVAAFMAGVAAIYLALQSPIDLYDTSLFSAHMVQHLLLTMLAAPLLALGAPITLALRAATPSFRRHFLLPILHSHLVRFLTHPVTAWVLFALTAWVTHFSDLFNLALENEPVHYLEHVLFIASGLLFWWPVIGLDPSRWRLSHPARAVYLLLAIPQNSIVGLAIYSSSSVLYPHYETLARNWGPSPLDDQQFAGGLMWAAGNMMFVLAILIVFGFWFRREELRAARLDAALDTQRAPDFPPEALPGSGA